MNGNIYGFGTSIKYHPLKTQRRWPINNSLFVNRYQVRGVYATLQSRKPKDITGRNFAIQVNIQDKYEPKDVKGSTYRIKAYVEVLIKNNILLF